MLLKRYDPSRKMNRWYLVEVRATLLDLIAVVCSWGSCRTKWEQSKIFPMVSLEQANKKAEKIVMGKIKRGYLEYLTL